jgi:hypothetical protein
MNNKMNYANDVEQLTDSTSTWNPPTQYECAENMVRFLTRYSRKKWYEPRKRLLKEALYWANEYNKIEDKFPPQ